MFSRLTQGVTSVLQELSGEEHPDGEPQDGLVPQPLSGPEASLDGPSPSEEVLERLAQTEQLVVQLKELIREKDGQLASAEKQLKDERELGEVKFTKLKLQAKAKMAALNKQITELKGQEGLNTSQSSESSFTVPAGLEEELQQLKQKLSQEELSTRSLREELGAAEQCLKEKEEYYTEQVQLLQAVIRDKDVRFQEQILKHEEELLCVTSQASNSGELQQALRISEHRIEELEEALHSRSQVLEMLQQELNSADQQKQILTAQFRQMEQELGEAHKFGEERQQVASHAEEQLRTLRASLEASEKEREQAISALEAELVRRSSELDEARAKLEAVTREKGESAERGKEIETSTEAELTSLRASLEASEKHRKEVKKKLEAEVESYRGELHNLQEKLHAVEKEKDEALKNKRDELAQLEMELVAFRESLDTGKEEREAGRQAKQALEMLWKGLHSLTKGDEGSQGHAAIPDDLAEVLPVLEAQLRNLRVHQEEREASMSQITLTLEMLKGQLDQSTAEGEEAVARIRQLERQLGKLQVTDESLGDEEADLFGRDLDKANKAEGTDGHSSDNALHAEKLLALEHQLAEKEKEITDLREKLAFNEQRSLKMSEVGNADCGITENITGIFESSGVLLGLEDSPEEDRTLIAVESPAEPTPVLSCADNESTSEITEPQPESPGELKGVSSDEMVTSSDSEVAHSSWTILEAVNADGGQEWPPQVQDFGALKLSTQSWEETSEDQVTPTCSMAEVQSSTIVVRETVQVQIAKQDANLMNTDSSSGHAFAQILAEELQKRYSELLTELQQLKDLASTSQDKVHLLQEELISLTVVKDETEERAQRFEKDLMEAQAEIRRETEHLTSEINKQNDMKKVLEEQLESFQIEVCSKDQKIQALQTQLDEVQKNLTEKEGQVMMLGSQLEDRELATSQMDERAQRFDRDLMEAQAEIQQKTEYMTSEINKQNDMRKALEEQLESFQIEVCSKDQKIQALQTQLDEVQKNLTEKEGQVRMLGSQLEDRELATSQMEEKLEARIQQVSQEADLAKAALIGKIAEIEDLQQCLSLKEQEMVELSDNMTSKLLQAGEEKFVISSEVTKLKEKILEIEKIRDDQQKVEEDKTAVESEELVTLRKENKSLASEMDTVKRDGEHVKRKLQAALVQRKELMKKIAKLEKVSDATKEKGDIEADLPGTEKGEGEQGQQNFESLLQETRRILHSKEEALTVLEQKTLNQNQALYEAHAKIQHLTDEAEACSQKEQQIRQVENDNARLQSQVTILESDLEMAQKKLQEAVDSRKETLRKAKDKDRHHREQMKQQKEEYSNLLERFKAEDKEKSDLLKQLRELESLLESKEQTGTVSHHVEAEEEPTTVSENLEKPMLGDWVQEDWVDFAAPEADVNQKDQLPAEQLPQVKSEDYAAVINSLQEEIKAKHTVCVDLEVRLQESQGALSVKETEFLELSKELEALRAKERQIDVLSEELNALREKCQQAEAHAEMLRAEVKEAAAVARTSISDVESPVAALQAEVEEFKRFLKTKNDEIIDLSQQLSEQSTLLQNMQETVLEKDDLIASLQERLTAEQERSQKMEAEIPHWQEEEKDHVTKLQQLQRKLQAALVSRKEALKENQALRDEQAAAEKARSELLVKLEHGEAEVGKLKAEKEKLIKEVDRSLLENQSLGATCESLKLAMDGLLNEKDSYQHQAESAREEAEQANRRWEEKVQSMKDEYETLLKSYENVSDEAERVRRVLEAARQERQELASKARGHEMAKQEAERLAEETQKEVNAIKEKMRKFAKAKHQKIMELEEENEKLREQMEKKGTKEVDNELKQLQNVKRELETLRASFDVVEAKRSSLEQETRELKQQLAQETDRKNNTNLDVSSSEIVVTEEVVVQQSSPVLSENQQDIANKRCFQEQSDGSVLGMLKQEASSVKTKTELIESADTETKKKLNELEVALKDAETKIKELQAALDDEKRTRVEQESLLNAELGSVRQHLQESVEREMRLNEKCSTMDTQFKELRTSLEAEKDDLEERLMNQLAQVNGSIAGYQQETADGRARLADLQRELEKVEQERAELEAVVVSERDRVSRLEEDKRQAQRERAEAEAEAGKRRELEQKLKSAQRVKEGSQSRARQLEELLREKQLEVRQMQKDCIQYQERISEVERENKALLLGRDELSSELEAAHLENAKITEQEKKLDSELSTIKTKLDMAEGEASKALADKTASEKTAQQHEAELKAEAERTLDEVRYRLGAELKQMELRLEQAYRDREREEEATLEARNVAEAADKYAQEMQARLDESLARLAGFSRSMSSLQNDRDRVLDEAKQWENRFYSALQGKEVELREAESRAKVLSEQLQTETTNKEELQHELERLQKAEEQLQVKLAEMEKRHSEILKPLEKERKEMQEALALAESSLAEARSQLASVEVETEGLRHRTKALEEAVVKLQSESIQARAEIKERETEERRLCLSLEQLETDLRTSKTLTETLQVELSEKEKREVELLGEKEQAVAQAAEEARKEADGRAEEAERQLEDRRAAMRDLDERLCKAEEEASCSKARLDTFTKAMGSLQNDRDRVLGEYKQLEERHLQVMMEKDGLIQEAATENNSLKEELRAMLAQRDDLHAENAKLAAQLHGYRDELKQVLTMKDSQHKQLLSAQFERIRVLEKERVETQAKFQALEKEAPVRNVPAVEHEILSQAGQLVVRSEGCDAPGAEVEKLREQLQAAKKQISSLEGMLDSERECQAAHNEELKELRWEGGVLRTEAETAEERVAELAKDLMDMEQKLLAEKEAADKLRAQNQAFGKAMASLQDSRDQAINEAKELQSQLEESRRVGHQAAPPSSSTGEVWSLKNALSALQNDRERLLEQLQLQRSELDILGSGELSRLTQALQEERQKSREREQTMAEQLKERGDQTERDRQELEMLRQERGNWHAQVELLKQQTLATLSEREQQVQQLRALLEEARAPRSKLHEEQAYRQGSIGVDSAPGGPLEHSEDYKSDCIRLQRRLDEETELRLRVEEELSAAEDDLKRYTQAEWSSGLRRTDSERAVLIEPPEGAVTRSRSGAPGLARVIRAALCSRQRTPLLVALYLFTIHALLLLCLGGYL
ncbi:golgin subfamily B member 1 isoform X1 [Electrophorus electricus]|uniref:golgin subfamily B member 1 isoform X1 n=1 Tax=Electrophorus electricus TaxID=8005 RepID=UPI0015CFA603|nr:golgin subfamily B member 1 isoform X1 [Electrophorus electricus]